MGIKLEALLRFGMVVFCASVSIFMIWQLARCGNPSDALWYSFILALEFNAAISQWVALLEQSKAKGGNSE